MNYHRQCLLERGNENQVSWIPEEFAREGKYVKLFEDNGWQNGWQVVQVGGRKTSSQVNYDSQHYKRHRMGSDI